MAKLILVKIEENPEEENADCTFAYFDGTPTAKDLEEAGGGADGFTVPYLCEDEVSRRAGLQRWLISQAD